jgi:hypothetical protein
VNTAPRGERLVVSTFHDMTAQVEAARRGSPASGSTARSSTRCRSRRGSPSPTGRSRSRTTAGSPTRAGSRRPARSPRSDSCTRKTGRNTPPRGPPRGRRPRRSTRPSASGVTTASTAGT